MAAIASPLSPSRRAFLRGRIHAAPVPLRPPWALPETRFLAACTRCDACRHACPVGIVRRGPGGYPQIDFSGVGCELCGACAQACPSGALAHGTQAAGFTHRFVIGAACIAIQGVVCRSCGDACGARAIAWRPRVGGAALPVLDAARCNGCGACVGACPTRAISARAPEPKDEESA